MDAFREASQMTAQEMTAERRMLPSSTRRPLPAGTMEGLFLRHEGYCGALGAFLATLESTDDAGSTGGSAAATAGDGDTGREG